MTTLQPPVHRAVAAWLLVCALVVAGITVVGGVTRLTRSGLSITEWKPVAGTLPPLSTAAWEEAFAKYRATPEYRIVNTGMTLEGFKRIFWWEYVHRLLARGIGVVFLVPFLWFLARRRIPPGYGGRLAGLFMLGGLQGLMGWLMVKSGLVDNPHVSPIRLTAHLGLAVTIFGGMLWTAASLLFPDAGTGGRAAQRDRWRTARRQAYAVLGLVGLMVLTGGLVAGLKAGLAFNTWPLMNGAFVPPLLLQFDPWWWNAFENVVTVQFNHRMAAYALVAAVAVLWWTVRREPSAPARARAGVHWLAGGVLVQATLGIATLLFMVPVAVASLHQAGALVVFALALNVAHALR